LDIYVISQPAQDAHDDNHHRVNKQLLRQNFCRKLAGFPRAQNFKAQDVNIDKIFLALQKFIEISTPEEGISVLQQHPELLTDEADTAIGMSIHHAREQGDEYAVQSIL